MADYYPLLAKAIAALPDSTPEARQAVYGRARTALFGQLRNLDPPVPEDVIDREAQALERAVAQLETEMASRPGPENSVPSAESDFTGLESLAAASPANEPRPAPPPHSDSQDSDLPSLAPSAPLTVPAARTPLPTPPLKVRRDPPSVGPGDRPNGQKRPATAFNIARPAPPSTFSRPPVVPPAEKPSPEQEPQVSGIASASSGQTTPSGQGFYPTAPEAAIPENPVLDAPSFEPFATETPSPDPGSFEPTARTRLEARRPYAPPPEKEAGAAKRVGIVAAIIGVVVVLVAIAAYKLRDRPEDLVRLQSPAPTVPNEAGAGGKIVDRISGGTPTPGVPGASASSPAANHNETAKSGGGPANPPVPVARRAALLVEAPEGQSKVKAILGTVVWRVENVSNGPDEPLSTAVRAEVDIPEEGLQAGMTIQKNFDSTLPASHTMKLRFSVQPDSPFANIKQVSVLLRREDTPMGDALKGITVPVTENSFLIGLSGGDGEASNLDLLRSREWFDIPMVLANGHIAKLTFEKGPSGQSALDDAMASWHAK